MRDKQQCEYALPSFLNIPNVIGFPVSDEKTLLPCQSLAFLGLGVNAKDRSFSFLLTKGKMQLTSLHPLLKKNKKFAPYRRWLGNKPFLLKVCFQAKHCWEVWMNSWEACCHKRLGLPDVSVVAWRRTLWCGDNSLYDWLLKRRSSASYSHTIEMTLLVLLVTVLWWVNGGSVGVGKTNGGQLRISHYWKCIRFMLLYMAGVK